MPRRNRKTWRRRNNRPQRRNRNFRNNERTNNTLVVPSNKTLVMKFSAQSKVTTLSATPSLVSISGNNINNIILSAASTSVPTGYNEWQAFYDLFEVIESRINVKIANLDETEACQLVCFPQLNSTTALTLAEAATQKFSRSLVVGQANGMSNQSFSHTINTKQIFGAKMSETSPFIASYLAGQAPAKGWFWNITIGNPDTLSSAGIVMMLKIDLTYKVRLQSRKVLRNSTLPALIVPMKLEQKYDDDSEYQSEYVPVGVQKYIPLPEPAPMRFIKTPKLKRRSMLSANSINNKTN